MKRMVRFVFPFACLFVWLLIPFLGLNVYEAVRWRRILTQNPFILAEAGKIPRPVVRPVTSTDEMKPTYPQAVAPASDAPKSNEPLIDREAQLGEAAARFQALSEDERRAFDIGLDENTYLVNEQQQISRIYTPREELNAPAPWFIGNPLTTPDLPKGLRGAVEPVGSVMRTGKPLFEPATDDRGERYFFRMRDALGPLVAISAAVKYDILPGSLWAEPGYRFQKGARSADRHINNVGFRGKDVLLQKPMSGGFRIACVGGSTTEEGPSDDRTYPALLEKKLNEWFKGKPQVEVINCGIPAIYSARERARFLDFLALGPDLILYYHGTNDICLKRFPEWVERLPWWKKRLLDWPYLVEHYGDALLPRSSEMRQSLEQTTFTNLRLMVATARASNVDMAFASFAYPNPGDFTKDELDYFDYLTRRATTSGEYATFRTYCRAMQLYNEMLRELTAREGLLYIPVAENIHGGSEAFWDICHLFPHAIEQKADCMFPYIRDFIAKKNGLRQ